MPPAPPGRRRRSHTQEVTGVAWDALDFCTLATASDDQSVRVWKVDRELGRINSGPNSAWCADPADEAAAEPAAAPAAVHEGQATSSSTAAPAAPPARAAVPETPNTGRQVPPLSFATPPQDPPPRRMSDASLSVPTPARLLGARTHWRRAQAASSPHRLATLAPCYHRRPRRPQHALCPLGRTTCGTTSLASPTLRRRPLRRPRLLQLWQPLPPRPRRQRPPPRPHRPRPPPSLQPVPRRLHRPSLRRRGASRRGPAGAASRPPLARLWAVAPLAGPRRACDGQCAHALMDAGVCTRSCAGLPDGFSGAVFLWTLPLWANWHLRG